MNGARQLDGEAPECLRLAEALRELRGRTRLSLAGLAAKTAFSKSSWERYLNGRKLPPRSAVEALCRVAGVPSARYVALWELAEAAWSGRGARPVAVAPEPEPEPVLEQPRRRLPVRVAVSAGIGILVLAVALTVALWPTRHPDTAPRVSALTTPHVLCHGSACTGAQPLATGCGDVEVDGAPQILRTLRRSGVEVEIRYKRVCGAAWVRVGGQHVGDRFEVTAPGAKAQRLVIADKYETGIYRSSPMVAVPKGNTKAIEACVELAGSGDRQCFRP